jgi:uncharacterized RDD family membrane protein YckC
MNAQVPTEQASANVQPAGFWIRATGRLIDSAIGILLGLLAGFLGGIVLVILTACGTIEPGWEHRVRGFGALTVLFSLLGGLAYHVSAESMGGATLGKLICRVRVCAAELSPDRVLVRAVAPCTVRGAAIRSLAFYVDAFFFGLIAYNEMSKTRLRQRLGDCWGKTMVVHAKSLPAGFPSPVLGIIAGIALQLGCVAVGIVVSGATP